MMKNIEDIKTTLSKHIWNNELSKNVDYYNTIIQYFDFNIPEQLKYEGKLYRVLQTRNKLVYNKILKNGFTAFENQKYYCCSKSLEGIDKVKVNTSKNRYKYFILFEFGVIYDDVLIDINKTLDYFGMDKEMKFRDEDEVLLLSDQIPSLDNSYIIDHGNR